MNMKKRYQPILGLGISTVIFLFSFPSLASVCLSGATICGGYQGVKCIATDEQSVTGGYVGYVGSAIHLFTPTASVVCPIIKLTSAAQVATGDDLLGVSMDVTLPNSGSMTCNLFVYDAKLDGVSNIVQVYPGAISGSGPSFVMTFVPKSGATPAKGFWKSSTDWLFAQIRCTASVFGGIDSSHSGAITYFQVSEKGADHASRIYPASSCRFDVDNFVSPIGGYFTVDPNDSSGSPFLGGFVQSEEVNSSSDQFEWDCHRPDANHYVDFMLSGSTASTTFVYGYNGGTVTIPQQSSNFPSKYYVKHFNNVDDAFWVTSLASGDTFFSSFRTW